MNSLPSSRDAHVRVALLTPPGRGALAVVGVAGREAIDLVSRVFHPGGALPLAERADGAIVHGRWGDPVRGEEVVVVRHSPRRVEVHSHGGLAASGAVIASLERLGAVRQGWAEWLASGGMTAVEVEARLALARACGPKAAQILSRQLAGALEADLVRIAALEADGHAATAAAARARLRRAARVGLRLTSPWRVVVSGRVNAGKSSLVNALAGFGRSIVAAEPGTTRDLLATHLVLDGWEVEVVDTAGLRADPSGPTEFAGIERARAAAAAADLVLEVVPVEDAMQQSADFGVAGQRTLRVVSKCDLRPDGVSLPPGSVATSSLTGLGIDALAAAIVGRLVPEEQDDPAILRGAVPFTARHVELIQ